MSKNINQINYNNLPIDFWDKVIFYEYFYSHSGFVETEPHVEVWTMEGKRYIINMDELIDGRYERVIPFFECMANKDKIERGDLYYFDWSLIPEGWKYYYHNCSHCFVPDKVYEELMIQMELVKKGEFKKGEYISTKGTIAPLFGEKIVAYCYKKIMDIAINEEEISYIHLDEKIHVYGKPLECEILDIFHLSEETISSINHAIAWVIHYTSPMEGMRNSMDIWIYFDKERPKCMYYNFEEDYPDYVDEKEFMEQFMKILGCKFKEANGGYIIDKAIDGYRFYQRHEYDKIYWVREDVYKENYNNVMEKIINYSDNEQYLSGPLCVCAENT